MPDANVSQAESTRLRLLANRHRYEKTKGGFLMRAYRNMLSRVTGLQKRNQHLYVGKDILPREQFYQWALSSESFHRIFDEWERRGYPRKLSPSVDRIDTDGGYTLENMEWLTHSENSRRGAMKLWTHCKHGHPMSGTNLQIQKSGRRRCRECRKAARIRYVSKTTC